MPNLTKGTRFASPERSSIAEAGLKVACPQLAFNFDIFREQIRGFQQNVYTGTGYGQTNAGKESVYGFEFDGSVSPVPALTIFTSVTYLRPKYDSYPTSTFGDLSGFTPATIPSISSSMGVTYTQRFGDETTLILRTDFAYTSPTRMIDREADFGANALTVARNY